MVLAIASGDSFAPADASRAALMSADFITSAGLHTVVATSPEMIALRLCTWEPSG